MGRCGAAWWLGARAVGAPQGCQWDSLGTLSGPWRQWNFKETETHGMNTSFPSLFNGSKAGLRLQPSTFIFA